MNASSKREKYEAVRVPMSEVIVELGDPSTWDAEDEAYERSIREKSRISDLPIAARTRVRVAKTASHGKARVVQSKSAKARTPKPVSKKREASPTPAGKKR